MNGHLAAARRLARILDSQFNVLGFKFGLDPVIGLFPWIGDVISAGLSVYIIWIAQKAGVGSEKIGRMVGNILVDLLLGVVPIVGTIGDFFFKANLKNLEILEKELEGVVEGEIIN